MYPSGAICICQSVRTRPDRDGIVREDVPEIDCMVVNPLIEYCAVRLTEVELTILALQNEFTQLLDEFEHRGTSISRFSPNRWKIKKRIEETIELLENSVLGSFYRQRNFKRDFEEKNGQWVYWLYMSEGEFKKMYEAQLEMLQRVLKQL